MDDCHATSTESPVTSRPRELTGTVAASPPLDEGAQLSALWVELVNGSCKVEESLFTPATCSLVVVRDRLGAPGECVPLPERHLQILEQLLVRGTRKSVAIDFRLSTSSVAEVLRQCLAFMGVSCWPSRLPLALVLAAHAFRARPDGRRAKQVLAQNQRASREIIAATRPDNELSSRLSQSEYEVTRLLVEGKSYAEMAVLRRTSQRTVANQLAAAFHRLGVSGRGELLCFLAKSRLESWQLASSSDRSIARVPAAPTPNFLRVAVGHDT